jgi:arylsulfatase A-like enzyme
MNPKILCLLAAMLTGISSVFADKPMNVVLILADDLGWMDVGSYGSAYYQTPAIDQLASEGVRFTDAYAACAVCTPTRAALLTGKYPARILMTNWTPDGRWNPHAPMREGRFLRDLPLEEITVAEALREAGYRNASIGKWHLGGPPFSMPEHHGFDINRGGSAHGAPGSYFYPYQGNWRIPTTDLHSQWVVFEDGAKGEYLTDRLTDEAIQFIRDNREGPFFLYLPHYAPHTPIEAKLEMIAKYEAIPEEQRQGDPTYAAMVESLDESVGRIMGTLRELDLDENTVVIFYSDNGGHWRFTDHSPLRGHKGTYWEGGIRVPLIIRWPGVAKPGHVVSEPVTSMDLYPTILTATGQPLRPSQHLDGLDLTPLLRGSESLNRKSLFWHFPHYNNHRETAPSGVIRRGDWKLIETFDPPMFELYNLADDIGESRNLFEEKPEIARSLILEMNAWREEVQADMMQPNPDYDPSKLGRRERHRR